MRLLSCFFLFLIACAQTIETPFEDPGFCNVDADCTCGGIDTQTNDCFIGNKLYASRYVDFSQPCPDFCSGIAGNLETRCVNNQCASVSRRLVACTEDARLCPGGGAVSRVPPDCEFAPCPDELVTGEPPSSPSSWHWQCADGSWRESPEQCFENTCSSNDDCQLLEVSNMCGPYQIAATKAVVAPIFYEDKCGGKTCSVMMAMCVPPEMQPKFTGTECAGNTCVTLPRQQECAVASDCVSNSCCHPTGCVPRYQQPNCAGMMCSQECAPGSLDCGGSCACVEGSCTGQNYWQ